MKVLKRAAQAGTLESCDIMILLAPAAPDEGISVAIESPTKKQYGARIEQVVRSTLAEAGVSCAKVNANDRGALDCTIAARVETAIGRALAEEGTP